MIINIENKIEYKLDKDILLNKTIFDTTNPLVERSMYSTNIQIPIPVLAPIGILNDFVEFKQTKYDCVIYTDDKLTSIFCDFYIESYKDGIAECRIYEKQTSIIEYWKNTTIVEFIQEYPFTVLPKFQPNLLKEEFGGAIAPIVDCNFVSPYYDLQRDSKTPLSIISYINSPYVALSISDNKDYFDGSCDGEEYNPYNIESFTPIHYQWCTMNYYGNKPQSFVYRKDDCNNNQYQTKLNDMFHQSNTNYFAFYQPQQLHSIPYWSLYAHILSASGIDIKTLYPESSTFPPRVFQGLHVGEIPNNVTIQDSPILKPSSSYDWIGKNDRPYFQNTKAWTYTFDTNYEISDIVIKTSIKAKLLKITTSADTPPATGGMNAVLTYLYTRKDGGTANVSRERYIEVTSWTRFNVLDNNTGYYYWQSVDEFSFDEVIPYNKFQTFRDISLMNKASISSNQYLWNISNVNDCTTTISFGNHNYGSLIDTLPNLFNMNVAEFVKFGMIVDNTTIKSTNDGLVLRRNEFNESNIDITNNELHTSIKTTLLKAVAPSIIKYKHKENEVDAEYGNFTVDIGGDSGEVTYESPFMLSIPEQHQDKKYEGRFKNTYILDNKISFQAKEGNVYIGYANSNKVYRDTSKRSWWVVLSQPTYSYVYVDSANTHGFTNLSSVPSLTDIGGSLLLFGIPPKNHYGLIPAPTYPQNYTIYGRLYKSIHTALFDFANKIIQTKMILDKDMLNGGKVYKYKGLNVIITKVSNYNLTTKIADVELQTINDTTSLCVHPPV